MYEPYLAIPTVVNLVGLCYLLSGSGIDSSISSVAPCELELRELLVARASLEYYRRLCWFLFFVIVVLVGAGAGLCVLLREFFKPVPRTKGTSKGILQ